MSIAHEGLPVKQTGHTKTIHTNHTCLLGRVVTILDAVSFVKRNRNAAGPTLTLARLNCASASRSRLRAGFLRDDLGVLLLDEIEAVVQHDENGFHIGPDVITVIYLDRFRLGRGVLQGLGGC